MNWEKSRAPRTEKWDHESIFRLIPGLAPTSAVGMASDLFSMRVWQMSSPCVGKFGVRGNLQTEPLKQDGLMVCGDGL
jgi:hypothetical protein